MFKLIMSLIPFIKELFFDKKEEMDFTHPSFNAKKWIQYVSFIIIFSLLIFVSTRLIGITTKYINLEKETKEKASIYESQNREIDLLRDEVNILKKEKDILDNHCYSVPEKKVKVKKS